MWTWGGIHRPWEEGLSTFFESSLSRNSLSRAVTCDKLSNRHCKYSLLTVGKLRQRVAQASNAIAMQ